MKRFTMNSDCMLNFLSIIQSIISVIHFALLFLQLVFSFACMFSCSYDIFYLSSARLGRNTRVHKYKAIIERHLRSFITQFCLTILSQNKHDVLSRMQNINQIHPFVSVYASHSSKHSAVNYHFSQISDTRSCS